MLFHLLYPLSDSIPAFNVFRYITFRSAGGVVTALVLSLVLGPWFIRMLQRLSVGQSIRDVAPETHQAKAGTPIDYDMAIRVQLLRATGCLLLAAGMTTGLGLAGTGQPAAAAEPRVIELTQIACQFLESENGVDHDRRYLADTEAELQRALTLVPNLQPYRLSVPSLEPGTSLRPLAEPKR